MHADPAAGSTRQLVSSSISFSLNMPRSCLACSNITALKLFYPSILCTGIRAQKKQTRSANSDKQKDLRRLWMQTQISLIHRRWLPEMGTDSLRGWNGKKGRREKAYVFFSLSFLRAEEPWRDCRVSAATFLLLKVFISSSKSLRFSSRFLFSSWCVRFSISNLSCSWEYKKRYSVFYFILFYSIIIYLFYIIFILFHYYLSD